MATFSIKEYLNFKNVILYPLAGAFFPVLFFFEKNAWLYSWKALFVALIYIVAGVSIGWGILTLITRNKEKSALVVLIVTMLFFSYGPLFDGVNVFTGTYFDFYLRVRHMWFLEFALLALGLIEVYMMKNPERLTRPLNIATAVLLLPSLFGIGSYAFSQIEAGRSVVSGTENSGSAAGVAESKVQPDIYYIILDGYAHREVLENSFRFDNDDFYDYLEEKGFFVARESIANYSHTLNALAASLNMRYVNEFADRYGAKSGNTAPLAALIEDNAVVHFLKTRGYTFATFNSGFKPTAHSRFADVQFSGGVFKSVFSEDNFLTAMLVQMSAVRHLQEFGLVKKFGGITESNNANLYRFIFEKLGTLPALEKKPLYVFAHIEAPHDPFVFDEHCEQSGEMTYVSQVKCVNALTEKTVDAILEHSPTPPVIIIQGDHGWQSGELVPAEATTEGIDSLDQRFLKDRMRNLFAIYTPGRDPEKSFYHAITPVNRFRILFNEYFGTSYELLPDRSYYIPDLRYFFDVFDVTNRVKFK